MNAYNISVIVPVFKGKKYLHHLVELLNSNLYLFKQEFLGEIEILFINDDPMDKLQVLDFYRQDTELQIRILNSDINRGIHGTRVYGLGIAKGDYIVFLDQDDVVERNYIVSQCRKIGDADAVICNGYWSGYLMPGVQKIYSDREQQREAVMLQTHWNRNPIVSPGQMLIKRAEIPAVWTENIIKENGADDYFLWIAMLKEMKKININEDKLYTHIGHDRNASSNMRGMWKSKKEVFTVLLGNGYLSEEEHDRLNRQLPVYPLDQEMLKYNRLRCVLDLYEQWLYLKARNIEIKQYLDNKGCKTVAIYGMGRVGYRLYDELRNSNVKVLFGIDRNAAQVNGCCGLQVDTIEKLQSRFKDIDAILVSVVNDYDIILCELSDKYKVPAFALKDIFSEMIDGGITYARRINT